MIKRVIWTFVLLLVLGAAVLVYFSTQKVAPPEPYTVCKGNIKRLARGAGRVEGASEPTTLSFATPGYVTELNAEEGKELDPEKSVAELSDAELNLKIAQAQANLKQATARLDQLKAIKQADHPVLKQAEERVRQVAEELKAAEARVRTLREPPVPPPAPEHEIREAARAVERSGQRLALERAALEKLRQMPTEDEKAVAEANVALARAKLDGAEKLLEASKGVSLFGGAQKVQMEVNVELARKELQLSQAQRDRICHGPGQFELSAAEAQVKLAQLEVDSATALKERLESPARPKPAAEQTVNEAEYFVRQTNARLAQEKAALDQLKRGAEPGELEAAEAAKEHAEKSLALLQLHLEGLKLRAPSGGLVTKRHIGRNVMVPAFSPIVTIIDFSHKRVRAELEVRFLGELKPGMEVALTCKAFRDLGDGRRETLDGKVERIVSVGTRRIFIDDPAATKGGEVVEALIAVEEPQKNTQKRQAYDLLLPGLRMDAAITLEKRDMVLCIPKTYVANDGKEYVLFQNAEGGAVKRYISPGLRDDAFVQIDGGLAEGDVIHKPEPRNKR